MRQKYLPQKLVSPVKMPGQNGQMGVRSGHGLARIRRRGVAEQSPRKRRLHGDEMRFVVPGEKKADHRIGKKPVVKVVEDGPQNGLAT